jgi:hypothetical protein
MNAIAIYPQGSSGEMIEYLLHNLKVEGSRPAFAQIFFPLHPWKIPVALKTQQKIQAQMAKKSFCSIYKSCLRHSIWVPEINITA